MHVSELTELGTAAGRTSCSEQETRWRSMGARNNAVKIRHHPGHEGRGKGADPSTLHY
jgi:hypothetical protein